MYFFSRTEKKHVSVAGQGDQRRHVISTYYNPVVLPRYERKRCAKQVQVPIRLTCQSLVSDYLSTVFLLSVFWHRSCRCRLSGDMCSSLDASIRTLTTSGSQRDRRKRAPLRWPFAQNGSDFMMDISRSD